MNLCPSRGRGDGVVAATARGGVGPLGRQKFPEVCVRQPADRAPRVSTAQNPDGRRRRSNPRGTSAAGGGLLDRATALALRTSERLASQRKHQRIASTQTRDEQVHGGTCAHDTAHTSVVLAARDSRTVASPLLPPRHTTIPSGRQAASQTSGLRGARGGRDRRCPRRPGSNET